MSTLDHSAVPAAIRDRQIAILRGWHGVDSGALQSFPADEQEAALRAAYAVSNLMANEIATLTTDRIEGMREREEPSLHRLLFGHGARFAESLIREGV